jgi:hypothetical protein
MEFWLEECKWIFCWSKPPPRHPESISSHVTRYNQTISGWMWILRAREHPQLSLPNLGSAKAAILDFLKDQFSNRCPELILCLLMDIFYFQPRECARRTQIWCQKGSNSSMWRQKPLPIWSHGKNTLFPKTFDRVHSAETSKSEEFFWFLDFCERVRTNN